LIFKTSAHCLSPSAPIFTNLPIQATRLPPIRDQTPNYRFGARTPNLQAVPRRLQRLRILLQIVIDHGERHAPLARAVVIEKIATGEVEEARENDGKDRVCFSTQAGPLNSVSPTWTW
jgi:hypothetical protein